MIGFWRVYEWYLFVYRIVQSCMCETCSCFYAHTNSHVPYVFCVYLICFCVRAAPASDRMRAHPNIVKRDWCRSRLFVHTDAVKDRHGSSSSSKNNIRNKYVSLEIMTTLVLCNFLLCRLFYRRRTSQCIFQRIGHFIVFLGRDLFISVTTSANVRATYEKKKKRNERRNRMNLIFIYDLCWYLMRARHWNKHRASKFGSVWWRRPTSSTIAAHILSCNFMHLFIGFYKHIIFTLDGIAQVHHCSPHRDAQREFHFFFLVHVNIPAAGNYSAHSNLQLHFYCNRSIVHCTRPKLERRHRSDGKHEISFGHFVSPSVGANNLIRILPLIIWWSFGRFSPWPCCCLFNYYYYRIVDIPFDDQR